MGAARSGKSSMSTSGWLRAMDAADDSESGLPRQMVTTDDRQSKLSRRRTLVEHRFTFESVARLVGQMGATPNSESRLLRRSTSISSPDTDRRFGFGDLVHSRWCGIRQFPRYFGRIRGEEICRTAVVTEVRLRRKRIGPIVSSRCNTDTNNDDDGTEISV